MLGNGVLGKILGSKSDEVIGEWRKLHNEELYDLSCPSTLFRVIKPRRMRYAYRGLVGIYEGKRKIYKT
jgi:hypothetical protein